MGQPHDFIHESKVLGNMVSMTLTMVCLDSTNKPVSEIKCVPSVRVEVSCDMSIMDSFVWNSTVPVTQSRTACHWLGRAGISCGMHESHSWSGRDERSCSIAGWFSRHSKPRQVAWCEPHGLWKVRTDSTNTAACLPTKAYNPDQKTNTFQNLFGVNFTKRKQQLTQHVCNSCCK